MTTQSPEQMSSFSNADMYQMLTIFLQLPTQDLVLGLLDGTVSEDVFAIFEELDISGDKLRSLQENFAQIKGASIAPEALLTELRCEYTRLFTHPKTPVIPIYETYFLHDPAKDSSTPALFVSPAAIDAERCYKKAGVTRSKEVNEPGDHMATEMEFMMYLYRLNAQALQENDAGKLATAQDGLGEFVDLHLRKWAIAFFERCATMSQSDFYQAVGKVGSLYLHQSLEKN